MESKNYVVFACSAEIPEDVTEKWFAENEYWKAVSFFSKCTGHAQLSLVIDDMTPGTAIAVKKAGNVTYENKEYEFLSLEFVKQIFEGEEDSELECICGEDAMRNKFWCCSENGTAINPSPRDEKFYVVCRDCGRIVDCDTLQVVGRRDTANIDDEIDNL